MPTWEVEVPDGARIKVTAAAVTVNPTGVLVFFGADGLTERAFAPGAWRQCEMVQPGEQGYGGRR